VKGASMFRDLLCLWSKKLGTKCPAVEVKEHVVYVESIPILPNCGTISISECSSICLDIIEHYGNNADLYLPDVSMKIYNYNDVVADGSLEWVDKLEYIPEQHDCDDFARELFGKWCGLAWTDTHALNWFIDENKKFWFVEPQTKKIADRLDSWQGKTLRFLLGA